MKVRPFALSALFALAALTHAGGTPAAPPGGAGCTDPAGCITLGPGDAIELGTILAVSGFAADFGRDEENGVRTAVELRGGTFLGHPIRVVTHDGGCSIEVAAASARALSKRPAVAGVVGGSCSRGSFGAAPILSDAAIMLVSPSATANLLADPEFHQPYFARTAPNDRLQGVAMAQFVRNVLRLRTAATVEVAGEEHAESLTQAFRETFVALKGRITGTATVEFGTTDFSDVLASLGSPRFVYAPLFDPEVTALAQQARPAFEVGVSGEGLFSEELASVDGVYATAPLIEGSSAAYFESFLPAYLARFGEPTSPWHALAGDATDMLLNAAERVAKVSSGPTGTTITIGRSALRSEFLATRSYAGLAATFTCDAATGDCNPSPGIDVHRSSGGVFEPV